MLNHQGAASSLAEILSMNCRWCCWSLTWRVHLMHDHFETTIRESNSYPCSKVTYPHQPLEVWNNHHRLKRVPGCFFFLGGKGKGIPVKKSLEGWVDGWKVLGCCCREPRHGKPQASKDWNPWRSLRLGVNVDDGIGGGQGGFADDSWW